jgi:hypothetical protein
MAAVEENSSCSRLFEAGDHAKDGGFAAAGGPEQCKKLSALNLKIDGVDDLACTREDLGQLLQGEDSQFPPFPLMFLDQ